MGKKRQERREQDQERKGREILTERLKEVSEAKARERCEVVLHAQKQGLRYCLWPSVTGLPAQDTSTVNVSTHAAT